MEVLDLTVLGLFNVACIDADNRPSVWVTLECGGIQNMCQIAIGHINAALLELLDNDILLRSNALVAQ